MTINRRLGESLSAYEARVIAYQEQIAADKKAARRKEQQQAIDECPFIIKPQSKEKT